MFKYVKYYKNVLICAQTSNKTTNEQLRNLRKHFIKKQCSKYEILYVTKWTNRRTKTFDILMLTT